MLHRVIDETLRALLLAGAACGISISFGLAAVLIVACLWEVVK